MRKIHTAFLFTELLFLAWRPLSTFGVEDFWLENHANNFVNYIGKVGKDVLIMSPMTSDPLSVRWFSLNMGGELPHGEKDDEVSLATSSYVEKFQKTHNISWQSVFKYDELNRWLRILNVRHDDADVFRVFMGQSRREITNPTEVQTLDVAITLMTYEQHECGFKSKPQDPKKGDTLILACSVIVNGPWNTSLVFRNYFDGIETRGEVSECDRQPSIGSKICSTVKVKTQRNVFAYSCHLEFASNERHALKNPVFQNSKWTDEFNKRVVCDFPKIYLKSPPSTVQFVCNNMLCGDTALVNDIVTCEADGYPKPMLHLSIQRLSIAEHENKSENRDFEVDYENIFFTADEKETEGRSPMELIYTGGVTMEKLKFSTDYRIKQRDVGQIEVTCNASNALGWEYNSTSLGIKLKAETDAETETSHSDVEAGAAAGSFVYHFGDIIVQCNGKPCKDKAIMKFGDKVSCYYARRIKTNLNFVMKLNNTEKIAENPCVYKLKKEDVGVQLVQCIGYTEIGIAVVEKYITVVCAFRFPYGSPHFEEDYDYVAETDKSGQANDSMILCNDAPCDRVGRIIYTGTYLTCRYRDRRVASFNLGVNGSYVKDTRRPFDDEEPNYQLKQNDYGTVIVTCFDWVDGKAKQTATVTLKVRYFPCIDMVANTGPGLAAAAGAIEVHEAGDKGWKPSEKPDSGAAAGEIDFEDTWTTLVPKSDDGMAAEKSADDDRSKHDIGSCGQDSFILFELFLVFLGVFLGQVQF